MSDAVIEGARVAAAHDGSAELIVTLSHPNGGTSDVTLDEIAAAALMQACDAAGPDQLTGHGWDKVRDALGVSWNRYASRN